MTHALLHADFYRVAMDRKLTVTVPVTVKGEARGVKQQGGVLDFVTREFEVECFPADIPEHIEVDVTELMMGQGVRIRDVVQGAKWTPISDTGHDARARRRDQGRRGSAGGRGRARCGRHAGRAGGHQEGQDRQAEKEEGKA